MAVMVTLTLKTDVATYKRLHDQMFKMATQAGLLFHSAREVGGHVAVVDFWPSEDAWRAFAAGPLTEGMKAAGLTPPDDITVTPVLTANAR